MKYILFLGALALVLIGFHIIIQYIADLHPGDTAYAYIADLTRILAIFTVCAETVLFMTGVTYWVTMARISRPPDRKQQAAEFEQSMRRQAVEKARRQQ